MAKVWVDKYATWLMAVGERYVVMKHDAHMAPLRYVYMGESFVGCIISSWINYLCVKPEVTLSMPSHSHFS